ncbi:MAG: hypothetical protein JRG92_10445 [Deltaproteobacteria bacterium]|nr:hypothetical protein [Deltaproteobacteria bacterium]MBW2697469.1 hypothetical protein [Deltaproteobacteria bacterium]
MQQAAKFEEITIGLPEPLGGVDSISAVVGIPEWWPTGSRVAVAIAHDADADLNDPLIECMQRDLAARKLLSIRFNFPFAESGAPADENDSETLDLAYRAALSILGRDAAAAPSHLFLGGMGIGGRVAAGLSTARVETDGVFLLGYPLHAPDQPDKPEAEHLYRVIPPMLFVQGDADPRCDLPTLRRCLSRVGTQTTLRIVESADHGLLAPGKSESEDLAARHAVSGVVASWIEKILQSR